MAAKKKASKKKGMAKKSGKGLTTNTNWQEVLAGRASAGKAPKEKPATGDMISTKGGKFKLGNTVLGTELDCVVLAWNFERSYYDTDYDKDNVSSPACAALGYVEDELVPHDEAANKQCDTCAECWANEWESADKGKGKACGDRRRLALVVAGKDDKMELKILSIAPTSLPSWRTFLNDVETAGIDVMQAAVNISFEEDSEYPSPPLVFEFVDEVQNEKALNLTASMFPMAEKLIEAPHDFSNYGNEPKAKKGGKKKASKKKASKKKSKKKSKFS